MPMQEQVRSGLDYLETITTLLQRTRNAHPTKGLYEAAEPQWWWSVERPTDSIDQLFWLDEDGEPAAAVTATDFRVRSSAVYTQPVLLVSVMPDATAEWVAHVVQRGLEHASAYGFQSVELEVDQEDAVLRDVLLSHGFSVEGEALVECWLDAEARSPVTATPDGYRLLSRTETTSQPHHMADDSRPMVEARLQETSLYQADLDLVMFDAEDNPAAYGMFWYDPATEVGVVEPMRTHDDHQQRGLARHILTAGIDRLADAGAKRISIGYEPDNPASGHLYRSVGFVPHRTNDTMSGPTQQG